MGDISRNSGKAVVKKFAKGGCVKSTRRMAMGGMVTPGPKPMGPGGMPAGPMGVPSPMASPPRAMGLGAIPRPVQAFKRGGKVRRRKEPAIVGTRAQNMADARRGEVQASNVRAIFPEEQNQNDRRAFDLSRGEMVEELPIQPPRQRRRRLPDPSVNIGGFEVEPEGDGFRATRRFNKGGRVHGPKPMQVQDSVEFGPNGRKRRVRASEVRSQIKGG